MKLAVVMALIFSVSMAFAAQAQKGNVPMGLERFWEIISVTESAMNEEEASAALTKRLEILSDAEIIGFERQYQALHTAAATGELWAAGVLLNGGHGSDDGFVYFRNWLIARGKTKYESALNSPDSLAAVEVEHGDDGRPAVEWESFGYVTASVFEARTGRGLFEEEQDAQSTVKWADGPVFDWRQYTNEVIKSKLPRLWSRYGKYKIEFDTESATRAEGSAFLDKDAFVTGVGFVKVGHDVEHRKLGKGIIRMLDQTNGLVRAIIEFKGGEKRSMVISPNYFFAVESTGSSRK